MNLELSNNLELDRCPHCRVDHPHLVVVADFNTQGHSGANPRHWKCYRCASCGGAVTAAAIEGDSLLYVIQCYPKLQEVANDLPERARAYLGQAIESIHAPAGAVMLCASAVDWMLKEKGFKQGNLFSRIDEAAEKHLITSEMAEWAHEVRLDANDQRHADESAPMPSEEDAQRAVDFTKALGEFLFVLPARVSRGRKGQD